MNINKIAQAILDQPPREVLRLLRERIASSNRTSPELGSTACIFVLSTGRVGTQTVAALGNLASSVFALHEPEPLLYPLSKMAYDRWPNRLDDEIWTVSFATLRNRQMAYASRSGRGYLETSPQSTFLAPVIRRAVPHAKFIQIVRDPRDVIRSGMRRGWYAGHGFDEYRITPRPNASLHSTWQSLSQLEKNAWLWAETNRWISAFSHELPPSAFLSLRSEELLSGHEDAIRAFYDFIEVPIPRRNRIDRILGKRLNQQTTGDFPDPVHWKQSDIDDVLKFVEPIAKQYRYSIE